MSRLLSRALSQLITEDKGVVTPEQIFDVIQNRKEVDITYDDETPNGKKAWRNVRVFCYGETKAGNPAIRVYQTYGASKKGEKWKTLRVDRITSWSAGEQFRDAPPPLDNGHTRNRFGDKTFAKIYTYPNSSEKAILRFRKDWWEKSEEDWAKIKAKNLEKREKKKAKEREAMANESIKRGFLSESRINRIVKRVLNEMLEEEKAPVSMRLLVTRKQLDEVLNPSREEDMPTFIFRQIGLKPSSDKVPEEDYEIETALGDEDFSEVNKETTDGFADSICPNPGYIPNVKR